jgi:CRP/FNR family cyclic AMP-dependent transcriptional regulator
MDNTKILEKVDIFRGLTPQQLESLAKISEERKYRGGEAVFTERSSGAEVYIIKKGKVCIELGLKGKPNTATVQRLSVGQIFGELALVDKRNRSAERLRRADLMLVASVLWE